MKKTTNLTIFLDIDGVLNTQDSWKTPFQLNDKYKVSLIDSKTGFTEAQEKKIKWNKI